MAKYSRIEVVLQMKENGIVPVFYNADIAVCKQVLKACYDAGLRTFEFTNRGDFAHEVFADLNKYAKAELQGMIMGVGSVLDAGTTSLYL
ncbi:MAG: bifunctional 4-hydroxy-2-oxoglutarate aldolase/2-dehydro-3-deoxy-phosphogluconate aldolase, partial [Bacteroidota bacterium]|nr:bifunctional 4-hydroxy-2-oxoglutarate aldolase/2-dehydro-3-deoxy-phosphogluconate aldolase [Bacteroidota bacterium]